MAVVTCNLVAFNEELRAAIAATPTFNQKAFSVFNIDDLDKYIRDGNVPPAAGVGYSHGYIKDIDRNAESRGSRKAAIFTVAFSVIIAVNHEMTGGDDGKATAMSLLDDVRSALLGLQETTYRPWRLVNENALDVGPDGIIYYGQLWELDTVIIGDYQPS